MLSSFIYGQDSTETIYPIEKLSLSNYWDAGDLLWQIPGFWMREQGITGQWTSWSVYGQNLNQSKLFLDDVPLINGWFDTPDLSWVPTSLIQSISHQPGTSNLHIQSLPVPEKNPFTRILYRVGHRGYSITDITFGQKYSHKFELMTGVIFSKYAENFTAYQNQKHNGNTVHVKMNYQISNQWNLQYQFIHNRLSNHLPLTLSIQKDTLGVNHIGSERYDHLLSAKGNWLAWQVKASLSHNTHLYDLHNYDYDTKNEIPTSATHLNLFSSKNINQWTPYVQVDARTRSFKIPVNGTERDYWGSIKIGSKLNWSSLFAADLHLTPYLLPNQQTELAGCLKTKWHYHPNLKLDVSISKDIRIPSIGERFGFPYFAGFPMSYSDGLGQTNPDAFISNKDVAPEKSYRIFLSVNWHLKNWFLLQTTPYYQLLEDPLITSISNNQYQMTNLGEYRFLGISSKIQLGPFYNFKLGTSFTAVKAQDDQDENLLERPNFWHFSYLRWGHAFFENDLIANLEVSLRQWTEYYSLTYPVSEENAYYYHPSQMILNAKGTFRIMENLIFSYAIENILGEILYSPYGYLLPGQTSKMGITWELYY